ncbi:hypothetical protein [Nocardia africana]|uniref:Uncharacterized protein n=1 Tax=Nocardia africana TaxID=134964 RepID=A0A378WWQ0_9NOCA|nr:hypothetical protein [Nocardia africana]MCC3313735.1 hypothetical protein [Nocardia africana]SUA44881.1 Uncharacterised protein [Nocardia africana]
MVSIESQFRSVARLLRATPILSVSEAQALQRYVTQLDVDFERESCEALEWRERVAPLRDSVIAAVCTAVAEAHNMKMRADLAAAQQVRRPSSGSLDRRARIEPGRSPGAAAPAPPRRVRPSVMPSGE